jgi:hypothetical protein
MLEINCPSCLSSNILEDREVARDIDCITCGATFFVETIPEEDEDEDEETPEIQPEQVTAPSEEPTSQIIITTGPPPFDYDIIDTIFVLDTLNKKVFSSISPSAVFDGAKIQLKTRADKLGGDAIINCQFDYRVSSGHGIFGVGHDLEIFAYGTLVRRTESNEQ